MVEGRSVKHVLCTKTRFRKKSIRMISRKIAEYELFWLGNDKGFGGVEVFFAKKWIDKVIRHDPFLLIGGIPWLLYLRSEVHLLFFTLSFTLI